MLKPAQIISPAEAEAISFTFDFGPLTFDFFLHIFMKVLLVKWLWISIPVIIIIVVAIIIMNSETSDAGKTAKEKSFNTLLQSTEDPDPKTRLQSMDSLEKILKDHPEKVDKKKLFQRMVKVIRDNDPYVRYKAVTIFGYLGDPEAITFLKRALKKENDSRVRGKIEVVIKYLGMFDNK